MQILRRSLFGLVALAAAGLGGAASAADNPAATREVTLGNPGAKVTVIEYASVTCPHCAQFHTDVFPAFKTKYVDTGQVHFIFREFPTQPANVAVAGFLVARCAPPDRYFQVIDNLFRGQKALGETGDVKKFLLDAGQAGGLDEAAVRACIDDPAGLEAFKARVTKSVETHDVHSTPTFVVQGKVMEGVNSLAQLDAAIQPLLAAR